MSEHYILIVVWIKIDDEWILIFYWICLTHWHIFVKDAAAIGLNFLPVSVCTVGERHLYPLIDKVTGVRVPDVIHSEAAGGDAAPAVVCGGFCDWDPSDLLEARRNFKKIMWKPCAMGSLLLMVVISTYEQNYLRPLAGGATQFAASSAKASCYVELAPGYDRNVEKGENDGNVRRDLADVLQPLPPVLGPCERIQRAIDHQAGLHTPGDSVEAKVVTTGREIKWNRDPSIERADEVNALVATRLSRLASEKPRTIILAAPVLKYAADTHLLLALGGKTKYDDFAIVDEKPKWGKLGPGGVHQVAVRTRSGPDSAPTYTYTLHMYQKNKQWSPSTTPNKALSITFDLLVKLLECGHLPEGTIVEVASPEEIGPAVLKVVKASNAVRERYGFRELTPTTLAHEYSLCRSDKRDKSSLAVLHLLQLPELTELVPLGYGQSELKHPISFEVDDIYVPASVVHVTYLMAPKSHCAVTCFIDSTVVEPPLFEHSACLIARIKLHEDSKPFHSKTMGGGKPFSITIKEEGKADVVLQATGLTDGVRLLGEKGITVHEKRIRNRLSGATKSDLVKDGKTCQFAYTKVTLPKKEELEQDMYLVLPFNNEKILEALGKGFGLACAFRYAFLDLKAFRADPLRFFRDMGDDGILSDEEKLIVARGIVTKKELKDKLLPYLTGYKTRIDAQCDEFLPSENFINAHVASTRFHEDAAALLNKVEAEMKWLYDAVDAYDDAYAAAQAVAAAQRAAAKAAKASPKKSGRKRKATVPKKTFVNSDDASDDEVMPVARPLPDDNGPQSFEQFDRVEALYRPENKWYPATVCSQNDDGTYNVEYDDGYFEDLPVNLLRVKRRKVAAPPTATAYQIGDRVKARYMGGNWFPGKVKTCHKEGTYAIKFDDGDVDDLVLPCDIRRAP
uniref:Tudor domain-containing protein n=1 Tax=Pelagomonas calceolata TaxID=35677 RepID=A0A7S3ZUY3_9STRA